MTHEIDGVVVTCSQYQNKNWRPFAGGGAQGFAPMGAAAAPSRPAAVQQVHVQPAQAVQQQNPLKMFVGGLSQETTSHSLNAYFSQFGNVSSIVMMDKTTGRSRGFGFVDFDNEQLMQAVLQSQHVVDNTPISCSAYTDKGGTKGGGAPHTPATSVGKASANSGSL